MYLRELVEQTEESKNIVGSKLIDLSLQYFQDLQPSLLLLKLMLEYDLSPKITTCKNMVIKISKYSNHDNGMLEEDEYEGQYGSRYSSESLIHYDRITSLLMKIINAGGIVDRKHGTTESSENDAALQIG